MPTNQRPRPTTFCLHCEASVTVRYWENENDPGERGMVRACGHGGFVRTGE